MANEEHLNLLKQGVKAWNQWREENRGIRPDIREAYLRRANLHNANLHVADLGRANLHAANLRRANLSEANLSGAYLGRADLRHANLYRANFRQANLREANLSNANLSNANLNEASSLRTNFAGATLTGCSVYGISAWNLNLKEADQKNLIITPPDEPTITVDNLEVAQFIYLMLHNEKIRQVIDTITSKVVLILGRFNSEWKIVLDAIRDELRKYNYLPFLFDFKPSNNRNLTETISTLAHMARFVIADITEAKSIPQELQRIIPDLPSVPVMPLIDNSDYEYALFESFRDYSWVLEVYRYDSLDNLLASLEEKVIAPAETKAKDIAARRAAI